MAPSVFLSIRSGRSFALAQLLGEAHGPLGGVSDDPASLASTIAEVMHRTQPRPAPTETKRER